MKVALIFNPFKYKVHEENLKIVQKYFGLFPPLSLSWVASIAEKAGHEVILVDARTLRLTKEEVLVKLKKFKPDILGFMMTTYMYRDTLSWIKYFKENLNIPVMIGGYNLRVYPKESLVPKEIDFGVLNHAYYTVPLLLKQLESNMNFKEVPGLIYKKEGEIIVNPDNKKIDFDKFPNPARHLLPNHLYAEFPTERKNFTVMVTSLGCPKKCTFCEAGQTEYSPRSAETVVNEMQECYEKFNVREIDIFDYEFPILKKRTLEICRLMIERKLDIKWACRARIDSVDAELLKIMKKAGCSRIYYGIESGSQDILNRINKGITLNQIEESVYLTKKNGIKTLGFFLIGAPGETFDTVNKTVKFAKKLNLNYVQFSKVLAKPKTKLHEELKHKTGQDYWKKWILGKETDRALPRPWTILKNEEIDYLAKKAYIKYHFRLLYIIKHILGVKSFKEFKRKSFAFFDMLFFQERISTEDKNFKEYNENI